MPKPELYPIRERLDALAGKLELICKENEDTNELLTRVFVGAMRQDVFDLKMFEKVFGRPYGSLTPHEKAYYSEVNRLYDSERLKRFISQGDSYERMHWGEHTAILMKNGFERAINIPFKSHEYKSEESFEIWFDQSRGFLLTRESAMKSNRLSMAYLHYEIDAKTGIGESVYRTKEETIDFVEQMPGNHIERNGKMIVKLVQFDAVEGLFSHIRSLERKKITPSRTWNYFEKHDLFLFNMDLATSMEADTKYENAKAIVKLSDPIMYMLGLKPKFLF